MGKKQENKNNKKIDIGSILFIVIMMAAGMICGVMVGAYFEKAATDGKGFWITMAWLIIGIYAALLLQIVIHEAGHLVFGLLSGYQFSSFRIGSFMIIKTDGKWRFSKFSLAGTGGQCLMSPPDLVDGKMPVVLYNLGGCIMNMIAAGIFAVIAFCAQENDIIFILSVCMVAIGLATAVTNGIPLMVGPVSNDGGNALSLGKNPKAMQAFWLQLKISEQQTKGIRLKDMPAEWFTVPSDEDMDNVLVAASAVFYANWLMDQMRLEEAAEYIEALLAKEAAVLGVYRSLLTCDRIYCELVVKQNTSEAIYLHNKEYEKFAKQMKNFPSILRTEYVYALLAEKDEKKAEECLHRFNKIANNYPYPNDIESERELMDAAKLQ